MKRNPTRCNSVSKFLLFHICMKPNMFRATPPIIRSLKLHWQPLVLRTWRVVGRVVAGCCRWPTTFHVWKTRGCQCSFRLLMMGVVLPETCWPSYKYGIIKILIHCCILLDFSLWIVPWCTDRRTSRLWSVSCTTSGSDFTEWTWMTLLVWFFTVRNVWNVISVSFLPLSVYAKHCW